MEVWGGELLTCPVSGGWEMVYMESTPSPRLLPTPPDERVLLSPLLPATQTPRLVL